MLKAEHGKARIQIFFSSNEFIGIDIYQIQVGQSVEML